MARIGDRQVPDFDVVLRRYHDLQDGRDRGVGTDDFRAILGKGDLIGVRLDAARLIGRRPDGAARDIPQVDIAAGVVARGVFRQRVTRGRASAIAGTRAGEHHRVAPIREQMRLRHGIVCAVQSANLGEPGVHERRGCLDLLGPRMNRRDIAGCALLQEQFRGLYDGFRMESSAHSAVEQHVGDGHDRHALMMRHVRPDDGGLGAVRNTRSSVVGAPHKIRIGCAHRCR